MSQQGELLTVSITSLVIMEISGTGRPNRWIRSLYPQGYANLFKRRQRPSIQSHTVPCSHVQVTFLPGREELCPFFENEILPDTHFRRVLPGQNVRTFGGKIGIP